MKNVKITPEDIKKLKKALIYIKFNAEALISFFDLFDTAEFELKDHKSTD